MTNMTLFLIFFVLVGGLIFTAICCRSWQNKYDAIFEKWLDAKRKTTDQEYNYLNEARKNSILLEAIKSHHDQKADDRCWLDDAKLYEAAGLGVADTRVGDKAIMLENCKRFIENRCSNGGPWRSYKELEEENKKLKAHLNLVKSALPEENE
jgi:hypothetical protein